MASFANDATENLLLCAPDTGWWGTWAKVAFNINRDDPYLTLPSLYVRAEGVDICRTPIAVQNEWFEFLEFGVGLQSGCTASCGCGAFDRGMVSTAYNLSTTNQYIRVYITDPRDIGRKIMFTSAVDQNGNGIYSQDGLASINGFKLTFAQPFVTSTFIVTSFKEVIKDQTYGDVVVKQVDATTGVEVLLARYTPDETIPQYRRYLISGLPKNCCGSAETPSTAQVTAMCELEFRPVKRPSDILLIGNLPALKAEMESIRYAEQDSSKAQQFSMLKHQEAVKLMNNELRRMVGESNPAINVSLFGTAVLERQCIGSLM